MTLSEEHREDIALRLGTIACEAGALLRRMQGEAGGQRVKPDGSPSTDADLAAERLILGRLGEAWPDWPVVAEETASEVRPGEVFFLVDPLDGTRDYIHGTEEYSVNIALVVRGRPVAAAIAAPALGRLWTAGAETRAIAIGAAAREAGRRLCARPVPPDGIVALVSRRHGDAATEARLALLPIARRRSASSALKFGLIAAGEADLYLRCGPTMEWDIAAGDHIVTCAGGRVFGPDRTEPTYGHCERGYLNGPFAAVGDPRLADRLDLPE